jgi:hypothetical protein
MLECLVLGDSIAVGVGQNLPQCEVIAKVGLSSSQVLASVKAVSKDLVVVSVGSNDPRNPELLRNVRALRAKLDAKYVIWLLPYDRSAAGAIEQVAGSYRDYILDLRNYSTNDGVHPKNYKDVAKELTK